MTPEVENYRKAAIKLLKAKASRKNRLVIVMLYIISEYAQHFINIENLPGLLAKMAKAPKLPNIFHLEPFSEKEQREWHKALKRLVILANREQ
jgi:hypothetical protein